MPSTNKTLTSRNFDCRFHKTLKDFEDFKTILCCPVCRDRNLQIDSGGKVLCTSCKREFYTDEGIYVFK